MTQSLTAQAVSRAHKVADAQNQVEQAARDAAAKVADERAQAAQAKADQEGGTQHG